MPEEKQEGPSFPPLLNGHRISQNVIARDAAMTAVGNGEAGAGDLFWSPREDKLSFALVLEPEVPFDRCFEILHVAMVAFADAAGALIPPEVAITFTWPSTILVNEGEVGRANLVLSSSSNDDGIPDWMILSLDIELKPGTIDDNPGLSYHKTTFWEEGCGHITRTEFLNSVSRHFLTWLHNWDEEGFRPVHDQWMQKLNDKYDITLTYDGLEMTGDILGLDETGNAIFKSEEVTQTLQISVALQEEILK